jgi:hypothetical protein
MRVEATSQSAAIAGAWAAFGLVPVDAWLEHHKSISVLFHNLLFLTAAAVFLVVPGYFLVIGHGNEPFSRGWFTNKEERARYGVIVRRMLVWFLAAGIFGTVWSLIFGFVLNKTIGQ